MEYAGILSNFTRRGCLGESESRSFLDYFKGLFVSPPGYYRFVIFYTTDKPITVNQRGRASASMPQQLLDVGALVAPRSELTRVVAFDHQVVAHIYEFRKDPGIETAELLAPGRLDAYTHLANAGLTDFLRPRD